MTPASEPETLEERVARAATEVWVAQTGYDEPDFADIARAAIALVVEEAAAVARDNMPARLAEAIPFTEAAIRDLAKPGGQ